MSAISIFSCVCFVVPVCVSVCTSLVMAAPFWMGHEEAVGLNTTWRCVVCMLEDTRGDRNEHWDEPRLRIVGSAQTQRMLAREAHIIAHLLQQEKVVGWILPDGPRTCSYRDQLHLSV